MLSYIFQSLKVIDKEYLNQSKPHLLKYVTWMRHKVRKYELGTLPQSLPPWKAILYNTEYQNALQNRVEISSMQGKCYVEIGRNLNDILHGTADPLELLFSGELARDDYQDMANNVRYVKPFQRYLDTLAHKNPGMKMLEIGAGTGVMTTYVLEILLGHGNEKTGTPRYSHYDFTDLS